MDNPPSGERQELKERTKDFALRIVRMFTALPKTEVARVLGRQALRAGTSVGANFREAMRARSDAEFVSKRGDCLKELEETGYWLDLLVDSKPIRSSRFAPLRDECSQLNAIITAIVKKLKDGK